jgi:hypothetical protein
VATPGIDFFRVDRSGSVRRLLITAGTLVAIGASLIGGHLVHRLGPELGRLISLGGGLTVAFGLILGFGAMAMLLFENVYLLIVEDGVLCHENGKETKIAWGDLDAVKLDEEAGFVVFQRREAGPIRWFAGKTAEDVRTRIEDAKRKALHGLLRASR